MQGPFLNTASTLLHRALQDENVLIVKFAEDTESSRAKIHSKFLPSIFHKVAKEGIWLGRKHYLFFGQFRLNTVSVIATYSNVLCYLFELLGAQDNLVSVVNVLYLSLELNALGGVCLFRNLCL